MHVAVNTGLVAWRPRHGVLRGLPVYRLYWMPDRRSFPETRGRSPGQLLTLSSGFGLHELGPECWDNCTQATQSRLGTAAVSPPSNDPRLAFEVQLLTPYRHVFHADRYADGRQHQLRYPTPHNAGP
ncbi:hypothetical protein AURDEDRAFT_175118 [Auricularia subglabra TFB-10046 SS5]|uniref:Uncharacterized protein n=1 Tax=Auricularia subglabra (strain TFB-10046 / SS5) TaxID=717982 RepID=J0D8P9_AURST|nr:hypothetical protein AURDEDRAFT_175118 [Auricularia subglabra TFB-10046 SS5]